MVSKKWYNSKDTSPKPYIQARINNWKITGWGTKPQ